MTKKHFVRAAEIVLAIRDDEWTEDLPMWANSNLVNRLPDSYTRAVQTAEAFICLFSEWNPRFDVTRFLVACGLAPTPVKVKRSGVKAV